MSEGLNLQDSTRLINYDIHWNPVRLMQHIGRVDRRMDPKIEEAIIKDFPELKPDVVKWLRIFASKRIKSTTKSLLNSYS